MSILLGFLVASLLTFDVVMARMATTDHDLHRLMSAFGWTAAGLLTVVAIVAIPTHQPLSGIMVGPAVIGGLDGLIALIIWDRIDTMDKEIRD